MTNAKTEAVAVEPEAVPAVPWPAVSVVMVGMFMAILDSFIVVVAGPAIQADLGASVGQLQWILAGYQLSYAVLMITGGRLADLYGRKRIFITGTAVFTLASLACAMAQDPGTLIGARIVQGLGAALMVPQVFAVITLVVAEKARHRVFGTLGIVIGLATMSGQLVGGLLIGADLFGTGWRSVFWVNVPIGIVTILCAVKYVPESRAAGTRKLDIPGVLALSAALLLLTFPLIQGREAGWPWWTWACFVASVVAFGLFVTLERAVDKRGGDPLMRLSLFAQRSFSLGIVLVLAVYALLTSYYLALSIAMQEGLGMSALGAGLVYTPAAVTFFVFSKIAGRLVPKYGRRVLEIGAVVLASGYLATAIVLLSGPRLTPGLIIPTLMLQSVGGGLLITPLLNTVLSRIAPETVGMASGVLSTAQQIGGALGVAVIGAIFFNSFRPETDGRVEAAGHAFAMSSLTTFAIAVLAAVLVFLLPNKKAQAGG
ncbi:MULTISPECIES: MFS transporter [unclassified Streptomyces]|uniref:MFS transporter n=1 Tax=unclassified Streptomyces TaxID=2593676 RepID=UPI002270160B|nr:MULTISPECIES: MFS transporter [unclassified Streptomyces]MCY0920579.1 MFS transporter [Streptomyces sp. H27-G5]MCY0962398.1 MFS transporter [Streptomyces sp. H27-H5]